MIKIEIANVMIYKYYHLNMQRLAKITARHQFWQDLNGQLIHNHRVAIKGFGDISPHPDGPIFVGT